MLEVDFTKCFPGFSVTSSFTMNNKILALLGPSGAGKTTVLRCIAGLERPERGYIRNNGITLFSDAEGVFVPPRRRKIGYVVQEYALFPHMNVKKNIFYGVHADDENTGPLYKKLIDTLKIEHLVERDIKHLSGGEKQRVALARALMIRPQMLLLDESFSALDERMRQQLQQELQTLQRLWNIPIIMVTHSLQEAKIMADQIIFVDKENEN